MSFLKIMTLHVIGDDNGTYCPLLHYLEEAQR